MFVSALCERPAVFHVAEIASRQEDTSACILARVHLFSVSVFFIHTTQTFHTTPTFHPTPHSVLPRYFIWPGHSSQLSSVKARARWNRSSALLCVRFLHTHFTHSNAAPSVPCHRSIFQYFPPCATAEACHRRCIVLAYSLPVRFRRGSGTGSYVESETVRRMWVDFSTRTYTLSTLASSLFPVKNAPKYIPGRALSPRSCLLGCITAFDARRCAIPHAPRMRGYAFSKKLRESQLHARLRIFVSVTDGFARPLELLFTMRI